MCYVNVYTGHQYTLLIGMCVLRECLYCYKYTVLSGVCVCYVNVYTGHQYTVLSGVCVT